jgi:hypothetical protein
MSPGRVGSYEGCPGSGWSVERNQAMRLRRTIPLLVAAAAAGALTLSALPAGAAMHQAPPTGAVRLAGPMHADAAFTYRTTLAKSRPLTAGTVTSSNWSGYAVTAAAGRTVAKISEEFTVPSVNCADSVIGTSGEAVFSDWAGLDGFTDATVEQAGTGAFCTSTTSAPTYFAFYEMYPEAGVTFSGVNPGDAIEVNIHKTGSDWSLSLTDRTNGGVISTVQACPSGSSCPDASAEVITEDYNGAVADGFTLADFSLDNQEGVSLATAKGVTGTLATNSGVWSSSEIVMDNGSDRMATPGPLYGGQSFFDEWNASS